MKCDLQQPDSRANRAVRATQVAPLGHRQLPAGLRRPDERFRRCHSDGADGQPAYGVPGHVAVNGRTAFVRDHVGVRDPRESGGARGQSETRVFQRADETRRSVRAAGRVGKGQVRHPRGRGASLRNDHQNQRADHRLPPSEQHHVHELCGQ